MACSVSHPPSAVRTEKETWPRRRRSGRRKWEDPKSKSKSSTPAEKASAKKRAKKQGRSKPSLVDNINAQKTSLSKGGSKKKKKSGAKS